MNCCVETFEYQQSVRNSAVTFLSNPEFWNCVLDEVLQGEIEVLTHALRRQAVETVLSFNLWAAFPLPESFHQFSQ